MDCFGENSRCQPEKRIVGVQVLRIQIGLFVVNLGKFVAAARLRAIDKRKRESLGSGTQRRNVWVAA